MIVHEIYPFARVVLPVSQINEYESEGVESNRLERLEVRSVPVKMSIDEVAE
jgi:hypothetical protein